MPKQTDIQVRGEAAPEAPSEASGAALPRGVGREAEPPSELHVNA